MSSDEIPLTGGRVTTGVVRVGDTVRRPPGPNAAFVRALLVHLNKRGFDAAPRYLGADERGREILSYQPGAVPYDLDPNIPDETLVAAAQLIRRYHDATAGSALAEESPVVCHGDLSPCNFVFRDGTPVAIIDFDAASPGRRLEDVGYAIFLWLNLGTDGPSPGEQARRIELFCAAYGITSDETFVDAIIDAVATNIDRLEKSGRHADAQWWKEQLDWLATNRSRLTPAE